jgi:hypothetical protein
MSFYIYADAAGVPAGYPGDGVTTPQWAVTLLPTDPQLSYATGTGGYPSNVTLTLTTPIALPAGTWWFVWAPAWPSRRRFCRRSFRGFPSRR